VLSPRLSVFIMLKKASSDCNAVGANI
jgi:hypothetical protein